MLSAVVPVKKTVGLIPYGEANRLEEACVHVPTHENGPILDRPILERQDVDLDSSGQAHPSDTPDQFRARPVSRFTREWIETPVPAPLGNGRAVSSSF